MLAGAVTSGAAFCALLSPPPGLSPRGVFMWLLITMVLFRFTSALFRIPYLSLGAELSRDYHGRTTIAGVRAFFGLCGTLAAAVLSFMVFFPPEMADARFAAANYSRIGQVFGLAIAVSALVTVAGTWSRRHHGGRTGVASSRPQFLEAFRSAWSNQPFRRVWLGFTLFFVAVVLNAALAIHYFTWYADIRDTTVIGRLQLAFYIGALCGVVVWVRLARRIEKRALCMASMGGTAALMSMATLLVGSGRLFGTGDPAPLLLGNAIAGLLAAGVWVIPGSMLADIADLDEVRGGQRREGLFFGLVNFGEKMGSGAALLLAGVLLDLFVGFNPSGPQTPEAIARIGLLYGVGSAVLLLTGVVAVGGYDLDRSAIAAIQNGTPPRLDGAAHPVDSNQGLVSDTEGWQVERR
jgi:GPH family glycoside/pentoside/hexuronide:cation symporter